MEDGLLNHTYNGNAAAYYATPSLEELGAYQFVSMIDIINNFRVAYVGEDKIIPKISRADIKFHAMRGLQELTYDTFRSCKALELEVPPSLLLPIPRDYVEYVKISWRDSNGHCHRIHQCKRCPKDALAWRQDEETKNILIGGERDNTKPPTRVLVSEGYWQDTEERDFGAKPTFAASDKEQNNPIYPFIKEYIDPVYELVYEDIGGNMKGPFAKDSKVWSDISGSSSSNTDDSEDKNIIGQRYGLEPQEANANGCFWVNCRTGQIHFGSNLSGKTVIIEYISDSLGTEEEMKVHKFAEEAMYKHIAHAILNTRANTDRSIVATYKKERFAAVRNAKLRLSSIKLEEITQIMRGKSKWIKH